MDSQRSHLAHLVGIVASVMACDGCTVDDPVLLAAQDASADRLARDAPALDRFNDERADIDGQDAGDAPTQGCSSSDRPACSNPDPVNCDVICSVVGNDPKCTIVAADRDGDTYLSSRCASSPGNDCDDANKDIHPGAKEICDGVDNDCNERIDIDDGLRLSGTGAYWGDGTTPSVAAAPERAMYGLVWTNNDAILFGTADLTGKRVGDDTEIIPHVDGGTHLYTTPSVAWNGAEFVITWRDPDDGNLHFQRVGSDRRLLGSRKTVSFPCVSPFWGHPSWLKDQWAIPVQCGMDQPPVFSVAISSDGDLVGQARELGTGTDLSLAVSSDAMAASWLTSSGTGSSARSSVWWASYAASSPDIRRVEVRVATSPEWINLAPIAGSDDGYAMAWRSNLPGPTTSLQYAELGPDGSVRCGPLDLIPAAPPEDPKFLPIRMVASYAGFAMLSRTRSTMGKDVIEFLHVRPNCQYGERFPIVTQPAGQFSQTASFDGNGKNGYAVVWPEGDHTIMLRAFGPHFCD